MTSISLSVGVGLMCALLSALGTNLAFLFKYKGAVAAPDVDMRHPLRSAVDLFRSRWWSIGWGVAVGAFVLHVAALTLAPISIGQAVLAGGLVFLAVLAERFFGFELGRRQWIGIGLVAVSLALLTVTGARGGEAHSGYSLAGMIVFEAIAVGVGGLLVLSHLIDRIPVQRGVLLGIAAGLGFGISDVAIKALSGDLDHGPSGLLSPWTAIILTAAVLSFFASARSLQIGDGVAVIAVTSVAANLSTILAGLAVFGDRLGNDALVVGVRLAAFALILVGAALIPAPVRAGEALEESSGQPESPTASPACPLEPATAWRANAIVTPTRPRLLPSPGSRRHRASRGCVWPRSLRGGALGRVSPGLASRLLWVYTSLSADAFAPCASPQSGVGGIVRRLFIAVAVAAASLVVGVAVASANTYTTTGPTLASGASPFAPGCGGPGEGFHTASEVPGVNSLNTEVEPWVEVNPQNPLDVVGFFQQDRWSDGGSHGLVASVSHDGGTSWSETWPAFSNCAGGNAANGGGYERSSDPWLSWSPSPSNGKGTLHAISISVDRSTAHNAVLTSRSLNGGDSWSRPTTLREDNSNSGPLANLFNDKESITADPVDTDNVYAVWDRIESPNNNPLTPPQAYAHALAFRGPTWFARSTNNGASWETARKIFEPQPSRVQTIGNQIVVLPDGTLVDGFTYITGSNGQDIHRGDNAAVIFSSDQGTTWSSNPTIIANMGDVGVRDPEPVNCLGDNTPSTPCLLVRTGDILPDFAVDYSGGPTNGYMYAVWQTHRTATVQQLGSTIPVDDTILLSRSTDGGHQWSAPAKVNHTTSGKQAFTASVHVASNGDVAVTYYDFRNDATGDAALSTDYWVVHCHAGLRDCTNGSNWGDENRLRPTSFDMRTAPYASGYFTGDYEGLDNFGTTFTPFFVQANGTDPFHPLSDAFYSTAGP